MKLYIAQTYIHIRNIVINISKQVISFFTTNTVLPRPCPHLILTITLGERSLILLIL